MDNDEKWRERWDRYGRKQEKTSECYTPIRKNYDPDSIVDYLLRNGKKRKRI